MKLLINIDKYSYVLLLCIFLLITVDVQAFKPADTEFPVSQDELDELEYNRDSFSLTLISPSGRFMVHYTLEGDSATTQDYADSAAAFLDAQWAFQVDSLGFQPPPPETDGYIHLHLPNLENYYGLTIPLGNGRNVPSFMEIENDFAEDAFKTKGLDALKVTIAHEFQHVIQFGYRNRLNERYFYEWCATWMEDFAYDEVNDYFNYLYALLENTDQSLIKQGNLHEYGSCLFIHYVYQEFGLDVIKQAWEEFGYAHSNQKVFEILLDLIELSQGIEAKDIAAGFVGYCTCIGERSIPGFGFKDAALFETFEIEPQKIIEDSLSVELEYWGFKARSISEGFISNLDFTVAADGSVVFTAIGIRESNVNIENHIFIPSEEIDSITFRPTTGGSNGYYSLMSFDPALQKVELSTKTVFPENLSPLPEFDQIYIYPAYPNPSNAIFNWNILVNQQGWIDLEIYNILGQLIKKDKIFRFGKPVINYHWNSNNLASGKYILRASINGKSAFNTVILLK